MMGKGSQRGWWNVGSERFGCVCLRARGFRTVVSEVRDLAYFVLGGMEGVPQYVGLYFFHKLFTFIYSHY